MDGSAHLYYPESMKIKCKKNEKQMNLLDRWITFAFRFMYVRY